MSNIDDQIKSVRTMEDIVNLLTILFTNLNNQNEMYYDMFLNPTPMDLNLERYDEDGKLVTVTLPNVAKMRISSYSGEGSPEGKVTATIGALYVDLIGKDLYYKGSGSNSSYGWQVVWSPINLKEGTDYLSPAGDGSQLQNLNAGNIRSGVLLVERGGTGAQTLSGILKGNGTSAITTAIVDEDYMAPSSFTGLIMYSPIDIIPDGWLVCDGAVYSIAERSELTRLCRKLGSKYGGDGTTTFGVPNLMDKYIKGGNITDVGNTGDARVGGHTHVVSGLTDTDGAHVHTRGTMNITGQLSGLSYDQKDSKNGMKDCFYWGTAEKKGAASGLEDRYAYFDASRSWVGETSSTPHYHNINLVSKANSADENDVDHIVMIPIIKY